MTDTVSTFALDTLSSKRFLRELRHFLWMEPHLNNGVLDQGWNCRDHSWVAAHLIKAAGHEPYLFRGAATYVCRKGKLAVEQRTHSWVGIEELGCFDFSIKPTTSFSGKTVALPFNLLFSNRLIPANGRSCEIVRRNNVYLSQVRSALKQKRNAGIYFLESGSGIGTESILLAAEWINSPLTDKPRRWFARPTNLYAALVIHLLSFVSGDSSSMAEMSQHEAWSELSALESDAPSMLREILWPGA